MERIRVHVLSVARDTMPKCYEQDVMTHNPANLEAEVEPQRRGDYRNLLAKERGAVIKIGPVDNVSNIDYNRRWCVIGCCGTRCFYETRG